MDQETLSLQNKEFNFQELLVQYNEPHLTLVNYRLILQKLVKAPFQKQYHQLLLLGLYDRRYDYLKETISGCQLRLKILPESALKQHFIDAIMEFIFLNLAVGVQEREGLAFREFQVIDACFASLFSTIADDLLLHRSSNDHLIARVLARSKQIQHMAGIERLADEIVHFQNKLTKNTSSLDYEDLKTLHQSRKFTCYTDGSSSETSLLQYLKEDYSIPLSQISREHFQKYRLMFSNQSTQFKLKVFADALINLKQWASKLPAYGKQDWERHFQDMLGNASQGTRWETLSEGVLKHLEMQVELFPGPEYQDDLLCLLQKKFSFPGYERIQIFFLQLIRHFSIVQNRIDELILWIKDQNQGWRGVATWEAILELIESQLTGLEPNTTSPKQDHLNDRAERKKWLAQKAALSSDRKLRELLWEIATKDKDHDGIQEHAWRILLRCLPPNYISLIRIGLLEKPCFFEATIEEVTQLETQDAWPILLANWDKVMPSNLQQDERWKRMQLLGNYFQISCPYDAVRNNGDRVGLFIHLALDDQDLSVRNLMTQKIQQAGYGSELAREVKKRELLANQNYLRLSNKTINQLEQKQANILENIQQKRVTKATHGIESHKLITEREFTVTKGLIISINFQIELGQLRNELESLLKAAKDQQKSLSDCHNIIIEHRSTSKKFQASLQQLANLQADEVNKLRNNNESLRKTEELLNQAQKSLPGLIEQAKSLNVDLNELKNRIPEVTDVYNQEQQRELQNYNNKVNLKNNSLKNVNSKINELNNSILINKNEIISLESSISKNKKSIQTIQNNILTYEKTIKEINATTSHLRAQAREKITALKHLQNEIHELLNRQKWLQNQYNIEHKSSNDILRLNEENLQKESQILEKLTIELLQLVDSHHENEYALGKQVTKSQELIHVLDQGRTDYDDTSARAAVESSKSQQKGLSREQQAIESLKEKQNAQVLYNYAMKKALNKQS